MKFLGFLKEEYLMWVKGNWGSTKYCGESEVFCNPTAKELESLLQDIRFIINLKTKKLYVWNWNITHLDMASYLYKDKLIPTSIVGSDSFFKYCFAGMGSLNGSGLIKYTDKSDNIFRSMMSDYCKWLTGKKKLDDSWTAHWFGKPLSEILRSEYEIKEEYVSAVFGTHFGTKTKGMMFVNPSPKDLRQLESSMKFNDVRYIINFKTKNIFVWPANITHYEAAEVLQNMKYLGDTGYNPDRGIGRPEFWDDHFAGIGDVERGKIVFTGYSDTMRDTPDPNGWIGEKQEWLNKYFSEPFIPRVRREFEHWHPGFLEYKESPSGHSGDYGTPIGKKRRQFDEEYYSAVRRKDDYYTIFKNPVSLDWHDLNKEMRKYGSNAKVRFIADINNQDIYVWDAHMAIHDEIERFIQQQGDNLGYRKLEDEGILHGNKIDCEHSLFSISKMIDDKPEDYGWMRKYFKV